MARQRNSNRGVASGGRSNSNSRVVASSSNVSLGSVAGKGKVNEGIAASEDGSFFYVHTQKSASSSSATSSVVTRVLLSGFAILLLSAVLTPYSVWESVFASSFRFSLKIRGRSFYDPYKYDHREAQKLREQNCQRLNVNCTKDSADHRKNLTLSEFTQLYDGKWPVVVTDIVKNWRAIGWSSEFFVKHYGKENTFMKVVEGKLGRQEGAVVPLERFYVRAQEGSPYRWAYVEDEHFISLHPQLLNDIGSCNLLQPNWFELLPESVRPWQPMFLWGTAYSRSPIHIDPYNWTGILSVVKGRKRVKLFPPGQDDCLYIKQNQHCGFPLDCQKYTSAVDAFDPEYGRYPLYKRCKTLDVEIGAGDMLIIPTGWFHQAFNVEETIAISMQLMNAINYKSVLEEIFKGSSLDRSAIPHNWHSLNPQLQISALSSAIPKNVLEQGKRVNDVIIKQLKDK